MKTITYGLVEVLDSLRVQYVIGMGEGAGANILARFGMDHPQRCLGLILIHCTSTVAGVMEYFRDKVSAFPGASAVRTQSVDFFCAQSYKHTTECPRDDLKCST